VTWSISAQILRCRTKGRQIVGALKINENSQPYSNILRIDATESDKNLVFFGIVTEQKYSETRAKSVFETWGRYIPGKILFFSRSGSSSSHAIPLVNLPGVDDAYPPQKKSFMMLKFIAENYLDKFEWFMRTDDDVYIKSYELESLLRSLDSSKVYFIGQAGLGTPEEIGLLSLDSDENFCMGGPGMIMSRATLKLIVPHIKGCLKNLLTIHGDVEIGRCVRNHANVSCTWAFEVKKKSYLARFFCSQQVFYFYFKMQDLFYHSFGEKKFYSKDLLTDEVLKAITLHPLKQPKYLYRLHIFLQSRKLVALRHKRLLLKRDLKQNFENLKGLRSTGHLMPITKGPPIRMSNPNNKRTHCYDHDFFNGRNFFSKGNASPKRGCEAFWKRWINDTIRQMMSTLKDKLIKHREAVHFKQLLYGYIKTSPTIGMDYIMNYLVVHGNKNKKRSARTAYYTYARQSYADLIFREDHGLNSICFRVEQPVSNQSNSEQHLSAFIKSSSDKTQANVEYIQLDRSAYLFDNSMMKTIHFVLPLSGRLNTFEKFINIFETNCLQTNEPVKLAIVLFSNHTNDNENEQIIRINSAIKTIINHIERKYSNDNIHLVELELDFSRSIGCETGASLFAPDALLFFIDVDMVFNRDTLMRIRLNTIENKQVYFPIVFSQFDPKPEFVGLKNNFGPHNHLRLDSDHGNWRQFGFGMVGVYRSDLTNVGGFNTTIVGWGIEDVDLYDKFIRSNLTVFRSVDPGLVHVFHKINCDPNLSREQMTMCTGSKTISTLSERVLANLIHENSLYDKEHFSNELLRQGLSNITVNKV
jgi:chondroitin sulfate synthase